MSYVYEFAKEYEKLDYDTFIAKAAICVSMLETRDDVIHFIYILEHALKKQTIESSEDLTKLCLELRSKIYDILIVKGDMFENNIIFLYAYFSKCDLREDPRLTPYEIFVDENLRLDGISDVERVFLIMLRFFASFANSKPYALENFFMSISLLHYVEVSSLKLANIVRSFFEDSKIEVDVISNILSMIYDKNFFFSTTPTQRRSILNWPFYCLWLVPSYYNNPLLWAPFYPLWKELLFEYVKRDECDEAMYMHFYIYHKMGNSFQIEEEWKMFNDEIDVPISSYYKNFGDRFGLPKCKPSQSEGKKIIGFLWDRLTENSPFKVAYSLWKSLCENKEFTDKFEIRIYVMSYFEKNDNDVKSVDMINKLNIPIFDACAPFYKDASYHNHLSKAMYLRQKMIEDGVDIMIHGSSYDIVNFLIVNRTAPKQIYWSHGNAMFNIEGIDATVSHCNLRGINYKYFSIVMDRMFLNPTTDSSEIALERSKYPKDAFILGTIGRLVKLDSDEYLEVVAEIMKQNPNTIYMAAGIGNFDSIISKIKKLGIEDRFYFPGWVDPHLYGHIIDLWLNTFPHTQGQSTQEFESKGKPSVTLNYNAVFDLDLEGYAEIKKYYNEMLEQPKIAKYIESNSIPKDIMEWNGYATMEFAIAQDIERYISKASLLIQNDDLRNKLAILNKLFCDDNLAQDDNVASFIGCIEE